MSGAAKRSRAGSPERRSALLVGSVFHRRHRPRSHTLRLRTYHVLLDVDELPTLDREVSGFGYRRAALTSFHDTDHFGPDDLPVRAKLRRLLEGQGRDLPSGRIMVLTNLRVLGHVFNPVSWWFCYDPDDQLSMIVAEVHNTFGDEHSYVLDDLERRGDVVRARTDKAFHVSPFLPIAGLTYGFVFVLRPERITVKMDVDDADGRLLDATQDGRRRDLSALPLTLLTHPLMTLRTVTAIHVHALRLWLKRVPFFARPPQGVLSTPTPPDARERPGPEGARMSEPRQQATVPSRQRAAAR